MTGDYHGSRLSHDPRRNTVWKALWQHHFRHLIASSACVLDLGAGYGDFINNVAARRRIAIDMWPNLADHLAEGVEAIIGSVTDLDRIGDNEVDVAFASNLFEHLPQKDFAAVLDQLRVKLTSSGRLMILQPNYRFAYREYFDDYTHVTVYSHISLADFLDAHGWEIIDNRPRFLPLTVKSRLPAWSWLIAAYLKSPIKPMGKQMLLIARPKSL